MSGRRMALEWALRVGVLAGLVWLLLGKPVRRRPR